MFFIYHALIENRLLTNFLIVTLVSRVGIMPKKNWVSRSLKPRVVQICMKIWQIMLIFIVAPNPVYNTRGLFSLFPKKCSH